MPLYMVLVLQYLGHCARDTCNFVLQMTKLWVEGFFETFTPSSSDKRLLRRFPVDVRTVNSLFEVEPTTITYATCLRPECSAIYAPSYDHRRKQMVWPQECGSQKFKGGKICKTILTKSAVANGVSVQVPIRPFVAQDFVAWQGAQLCRPGIIDAVKSYQAFCKERAKSGELYDIADGSVFREIRDAHGHAFLPAPDGELRLLYAASVDDFNPRMNKAAGKSVSTGSIVLVNLMLPPSLRYKAENMFLLGIIPHPQPRLEAINCFLDVLVDSLLRSYHCGTKYSQLPSYPKGVRVRSALATVITDLPGSKKVRCNAAISHRLHPCSYCKQPYDGLIDLDYTGWQSRTTDEQREAGRQWQNAQDNTARSIIFESTGVRCSALHRLPYWDAVRYVVVDPMHNLFLGLVQHHVRIILGVNQATVRRRPPTTAQVEHVQTVLASNPSQTRLQKVPIDALRVYCERIGIRSATDQGTWVGKKELVRSLLVSICYSLTLPAVTKNFSFLKSHSSATERQVVCHLMLRTFLTDMVITEFLKRSSLPICQHHWQ